MSKQQSSDENIDAPKITGFSDTDAIATMGTSSAAQEKTMKGRVRAWALWDWGSAAFNAVVTTFVFSRYLSSDYFIPQAIIDGKGTPAGNTAYIAEQAANTSVISTSLAVAGFVIAVVAPVLGQRSDGSGKRKLWLAVNTGLVVLSMLAMYFVEPHAHFLLLGAILLAVGNVFFEFASVNYNAMLLQISTRENMGRVSGFGWGMGYIGGIVLLLLLLVLFIEDLLGVEGHAGLLALASTQDGGALNIRVAIVVSAIWFAIFAIPVLLKVPELPKTDQGKQPNYFQSYGILVRTIAKMAKKSPNVLLFLVSSAIFRDGLSAIFTFGAIIAATVFGFSSSMVIYFAVAANLIAGIGTFVGGRLDDKIGPKNVIIISLIAMSLTGLGIFFLPREDEGQGGPGFVGFWILGLILCTFVGPVQSASRSFLARITPIGREGEIFGLYATTGRAVGFITSAIITVFISTTGDNKWAIIGIVIVLLAGLGTMIPVKAKQTALD
ncbi:MAG: MFS transporter [Microbacteriaceae bacterium]